MNPVVPRNILFLTMMVIVCFFACSMAKKRDGSTTLKYEHGDDVSCGKGLNEVCCPVIELDNPNADGGSTNQAKNDPGRAGCRCRCEELLIDEDSAVILAIDWPKKGYCAKDKGGWVPPTEGTPSKKAAKKYKKL